MRTLKEKYSYNKSKRGEFSAGYCLGVDIYNDYPKGNDSLKSTYKSLITNAKKLALKGDSYGKGIMCGVRDAASERKARCRKH